MMEVIKKTAGRIREEERRVRREFKQRTSGYILAAFGLVAGLAWNEAIKSLIAYVFPAQQNTVAAQFIYAVVLTVILVLVTISMMRFFGEDDQNDHLER